MAQYALLTGTRQDNFNKLSVEPFFLANFTIYRAPSIIEFLGEFSAFRGAIMGKPIVNRFPLVENGRQQDQIS